MSESEQKDCGFESCNSVAYCFGNDLIYFWAHQMLGKLSELEEEYRVYIRDRPYYSSNNPTLKDYMFREAVRCGNEVAVRYFMKGSQPTEECPKELTIEASKLGSNKARPPSLALPQIDYSVITRFLVVRMSKTQRRKVLTESFLLILRCLLNGPWSEDEHSIIVSAQSMLSNKDYAHLLSCIVVWNADFFSKPLFLELWKKREFNSRIQLIRNEEADQLFSILYVRKDLLIWFIDHCLGTLQELSEYKNRIERYRRGTCRDEKHLSDSIQRLNEKLNSFPQNAEPPQLPLSKEACTFFYSNAKETRLVSVPKDNIVLSYN